jgi:membrane protease YdiL (CAAX protease family)
MRKIFLDSILPLLPVLALAVFFVKDRKQYKTVGLFSLIFVIQQIVLKLPTKIYALQIIHSKWNWTGKLLGIALGLILYFLLRQRLKPFDFFRLKQNPKSFKTTLLITIVMTCFSFFAYFDTAKQFDAETLVYQLTMPGLDEEIFYRGILFGLLLTCLKDEIKINKMTFGNPSVLLIGLLFGLVHGLGIEDNFQFKFEPYPFIFTFINGYVWSWITLASRSILQATISHNLMNFVGNLIRMIK